MAENDEVLVLRHNPERRAFDSNTVLRMFHRPNRPNRSDSAVIQMSHRQGALHNRELHANGITSITEEAPEFCPNHCPNRCTETTVNGEAKWVCPSCGIIF